MTIINITEMNNEQLTEVFNANRKLQEKVLEDMIDSEMMWIGEELAYLKSSLKDWSIGTCQYNYIKVGDSQEFIAKLKDLQQDYGLFSDSEKHIITDTEALADKYFNMEGPYEGDFEDYEDYEEALEVYEQEMDELEEQFEEAVEALAEAVADKYTERLDYFYASEAQLNYFLEFYANERLDDNYYIDTTNTANPYELFQDVAYTKSFK